MGEHRLKVVEPYFDALWDGTKTFEVRRNDRAFQTGDSLVLIETGPRKCDDPQCGATCQPRAMTARIAFVYSGDPRFGGHGGMQIGYVVLGLAAISALGGDR